MNVRKASHFLRRLLFRSSRFVAGLLPGGGIEAFGEGDRRIGSIVVINLRRQPERWDRLRREMARFRTVDGAPLASIATRFEAVDARDRRTVAATADVDSTYRLADQLSVQPDARLAAFFDPDERIRMTPQEIAIARSHIEVWKTVAFGPHAHVLVLEDDVWFRPGAARMIDRGWKAALDRGTAGEGPRLLYLSYSDADGTVARADVCDAAFRPERGIWFLSGYVLSREGARALLEALPVVGPVDLWINYRFPELGALALREPAILQRRDCASQNSYSIMPYLAGAGIVDVGSLERPSDRARAGPLLAWTRQEGRESLPLALSMLGLRVRAFDDDEPALGAQDLASLFETFDALIDPPLAADAVHAAFAMRNLRFLLEHEACPAAIARDRIRAGRILEPEAGETAFGSWGSLCDPLRLDEPEEVFPTGAAPSRRLSGHAPDLTRGGRSDRNENPASRPIALDPAAASELAPSPFRPRARQGRRSHSSHERLTTPSPHLQAIVETFHGNRAAFTPEGLVHTQEGARLDITKAEDGAFSYRSGAFASVRAFAEGRFEAEIRPAAGPGLVTGFFLYRGRPRQEIDIEFTGDDPRSLLTNVYFNPGDEDAGLGFGYRGSPVRVDLGFDASQEFHRYAIDWRAERILWLVDGRIVHERAGWDPTPIPHLPMRLHANLWAPLSLELAGRLEDARLPAATFIRDIRVSG